MGLAARVFERAGLPTVCLSSCLDISERIRPPRTAFLNFPLGNQCGPPHDADLQRRILAASLELLHREGAPGAIVGLPERWPKPAWQAKVIADYQAEAAIVRKQRLGGEYDRAGRNYAAQECLEVCALV